MAHSLRLQLSSNLTSTFKSNNKSGSNVLKVVVGSSGKEFELERSSSGDFDSLPSFCASSKPCYLLYRRGAGDWAFITWMPEGVAVKDRMLYSAGKETLKKGLGFEYFNDDATFHDTSEFKGSFLGKSKGGSSRAAGRSSGGDGSGSGSGSGRKGGSNRKKGGSFRGPRLTRPLIKTDEFGNAEFDPDIENKPYSKTEKMLIQARKEEEKERNRRSMLPGGEAGQRVTSGYHAVMIPLTAEASDACIAVSKGGSNNWVHLEITDNKDNIKLVKTSKVSNSGTLPVDDKKAGYYLYHCSRGTAFIYMCPEATPAKRRMVYSTAKPAILTQFEMEEIEIGAKFEESDAKDCTVSAVVAAFDVDDSKAYAPPNQMGSLAALLAGNSPPSSPTQTTAKDNNSAWKMPLPGKRETNSKAKRLSARLFGTK